MAEITTQSQYFLKLKCVSKDEYNINNTDELFSDSLNFILSDGDLSERIQAVQITFLKILPKISIPSDKLSDGLKEIIAVTKSLFDLCLDLVKSSLGDIKQLTSTLENVGQLIGALISCVNYLITCESLSFDYVVVLLHILEKSYNHCSQCETFYKDVLVHVKDILQNIIMQCHDMQSKVLVYLDRIQEKIELFENHDSGILTSVMDALFNVLCPLGEVLEIRSTIPIWRAYFKLLSKYQDTLLGELNMSPVVMYLCSKAPVTLEQGILCDTPDAASKSIKLCSFLFKLIVNLCDKFIGFLESCMKDIVFMCLTLLKLSPPSLYVKCKPEICDEIKRTLLVGLDPLIDCLLCDEGFARTVLQLVPQENDGLAFSRFCAIILHRLPSNTSAKFNVWFPEIGPSILTCLFQGFQLCTVECLLPVYLDGIMHKGKAQQSVSYFQFICVRICSFVSSLSSSQFQAVEPYLFEYVLSNNFMSALLASDVLCFVARFSTSELAYVHCRHMARILCSVKRNQQNFTVPVLNLCALFNRFFAFLTKTDQAKVMSEFSETAVVHCLKALSFQLSHSVNCVQSEFKTLHDLDENFNYLERRAKTAKILTQDEELFLLKLLLSASDAKVAIILTNHILSRTNDVIQFLTSFEKTNLLAESLQKCVIRGSDNVHLVLISSYQNLIRNAPSPQLVSILARCAAISLNATNVCMRELAFERFAEVSHPVLNEHLIRQTLKMCSPGVMIKFKEYMKMYISKQGATNDEKRLELIKCTVQNPQQKTEELPPDDLAFDLTDLMCDTSGDAEEAPLTKRVKSDSSLNDILQSVNEAVKNLESECQNFSLDNKSEQQVRGFITRLTNLI